MGASAPVSAYVDDKELRSFVSRAGRTKIKKIIDLKEKSKPATVEVSLTGKDGLIVESNDGSVTK